MLQKLHTPSVKITEFVTLSVFHGRDGLDAIQTDWLKLNDSQSALRFYQSFAWYRSYLETIEADEQSVSFYVFYRQQSPAAIFPLRTGSLELNGIKLRCLELPWHSHMHLRDIVCDPSDGSADLFLSLVSYLRHQKETPWDLIYMSHVPDESAITLAMRQKAHALCISRQNGRSSSIPCGGSYDTVSENMSGTFRRNLRRLTRRAEQAGPLELQVCHTPEDLYRAFPAFLEVEASGWKGGVGAGSAIACQPDLVEFYRNIIKYFSATGACIINLLYQNGICLAGQFCVQINGTLNVLKIGYHEAYSEIAPGNLLMNRVIENSCRSGAIKAVSFVTDPVWSRPWRPSSIELFDYYLFNRTWRGMLAWAIAKGRGHVSRLFKGRVENGNTALPVTNNQSITTQEDKT
jgi:hypothetical protein